MVWVGVLVFNWWEGGRDYTFSILFRLLHTARQPQHHVADLPLLLLLLEVGLQLRVAVAQAEMNENEECLRIGNDDGPQVVPVDMAAGPRLVGGERVVADGGALDDDYWSAQKFGR